MKLIRYIIRLAKLILAFLLWWRRPRLVVSLGLPQPKDATDPTSMRMLGMDANLKASEKVDFHVHGEDAGHAEVPVGNLKWVVADPAVVSVELGDPADGHNGFIVAQAVGETDLTVSLEDDSLPAVVHAVVVADPAVGLVVTLGVAVPK
jgi:hypothetical protein